MDIQYVDYSFKNRRKIKNIFLQTPKIKGVQVYNYKEVKNEIIIDFDIELDLVPQTKDYFINKLLFRYDGSCDISFSVYGIQGSIKDFRVSINFVY